MIKNRIIPCLLINEDKLVKSVKFKDLIYVGDYLNAIKVFNEKEVDELIVLDISASKNKSGPNFDLIKKISNECFMPVCYGGGIRSLEDAKKVFSLGVEKISLKSSILYDTSLISELTNYFGSQSIVISIDIKKDWLGNYRIYDKSKNLNIKENWKNFINIVQEKGAGEILLNSVDKDGLMDGPDLQLIEEATTLINIPMIYIGGVGSINHLKTIFNKNIKAVAAGSFFIFKGPHKAVLITYPKNEMLDYQK
jgi:imidazole glycerol-phosphate synthase subunit HisF